MGGAAPRAAVRASTRRDSVTREGAARFNGAARSRGALPARLAVWLTVTAAGRRQL